MDSWYETQPTVDSLFHYHPQIQHVYHGDNPEVSKLLSCPGPFWGRQYFFWHGNKPLTLIYEVFSNQLTQYLGPCKQPGM